MFDDMLAFSFLKFGGKSNKHPPWILLFLKSNPDHTVMIKSKSWSHDKRSRSNCHVIMTKPFPINLKAMVTEMSDSTWRQVVAQFNLMKDT